jgi:predicted patatin/cPLA2 family phospholipase
MKYLVLLAISNMRKKTLIIQGGGFRTSFSAGVLDAFIAHNYNPFDQYIAISAGSIGLSYYLSRQYRHYYKAMCLLAEDNDFISYNKLMSAEGMMNVDFFREIANEKIPFDYETALSVIQNKEITFVMTNRTTGEAHYHTPTKETWMDAIIASCTLPFVTKGEHKIDGIGYMDGGWSDSLPVEWAFENGARDIVIIRTTPTEVKISQSWPDYFGSFYFWDNEKLQACFENNHVKYNASIDYINNPPKGLKITQIAPEDPLQTGTYSNSVKLITSDYRYGMECGLNYIQSLKEDDGSV